jgi:hypothetical protein
LFEAFPDIISSHATVDISSVVPSDPVHVEDGDDVAEELGETFVTSLENAFNADDFAPPDDAEAHLYGSDDDVDVDAEEKDGLASDNDDHDRAVMLRIDDESRPLRSAPRDEEQDDGHADGHESQPLGSAPSSNESILPPKTQLEIDFENIGDSKFHFPIPVRGVFDRASSTSANLEVLQTIPGLLCNVICFAYLIYYI